MIPATVADRTEIEAFLTARITRSMFPLVNLRDHGWDSDAPYAMRFWLRREGGTLRDVLGVTNGGMLMPQGPDTDWAGAAQALTGREVTGLIGPADQARRLQAALGLENAPATLDRDEPFMELDLGNLKIPDGPGQIVPLVQAPRPMILDWMTAYQIEALQTPSEAAREQASASYRRYAERGSHAVLMDGDTPLAMTGFNAQLPGIVQIGGVYTPPERRNRGHARRALALHLAQARDEGVTRSVLFSGSDAAKATYERLGYRQDGHWTLCLFDGPQVIHG